MDKKALVGACALTGCVLALPLAAESRRISLDDYRDKMRGAWIGQMVGVSWGMLTEFKWNDSIIPEDKVPAWQSDLPLKWAYNNDDLYVEMTFLKTLEDHGLDVLPRQAGIDFANSEYALWCANQAGRTNLRKGIAPPVCSHPKFHACPNDIDYQIEADYAGIIAPGDDLAAHKVEVTLSPAGAVSTPEAALGKVRELRAEGRIPAGRQVGLRVRSHLRRSMRHRGA